MSLIHGQDANNNLVPLLLDTSGKILIYGNVPVQLVAGVALIGKVDINTMPGGLSTLQVRGDNLDKIWAYDSNWITSPGSGALTAGTNNIDDTAVPANKVLVVTDVAVRYIGTITNVFIRLDLRLGGSAYVLWELNSFVSDSYKAILTNWFIPSGWNVRIEVHNATVSDQCYGTVHGYLMDVT